MLLFTTIQSNNWLIVVCFFVSFLFPDAWKCIRINGINHARTRVLTLGCVLVHFLRFHRSYSFSILLSSVVDCRLGFPEAKTSPYLMIWYPGKYSISIGGNGIFLIVVVCCCCVARSPLIVTFLGGGIHHWNLLPPLSWGWRPHPITSTETRYFFHLQPGHSVAPSATPDPDRPPPIDCYVSGLWKAACGGRRVPFTPSTTTVSIRSLFFDFFNCQNDLPDATTNRS